MTKGEPYGALANGATLETLCHHQVSELAQCATAHMRSLKSPRLSVHHRMTCVALKLEEVFLHQAH